MGHAFRSVSESLSITFIPQSTVMYEFVPGWEKKTLAGLDPEKPLCSKNLCHSENRWKPSGFVDEIRGHFDWKSLELKLRKQDYI